MTKNERLTKLYIDAESADGYHRDGCVFREDVDIHDTMSALITYSNGVTMTYSLNAFMPFEGHRIAFNCERGRLEMRHYDRQPWQKEGSVEFHLTTNWPDGAPPSSAADVAASRAATQAGGGTPPAQPARTPAFQRVGRRRELAAPVLPGGHDGGDPILLDTIFAGAERPEHLKLPGTRAGALSCLTGIAARRSCEERRPVRIAELARLG